jgi:phosphatidylinositol phospholipase C, gamma-1
LQVHNDFEIAYREGFFIDTELFLSFIDLYRIKIKQERGSTKYYLFENVLFDNLYSLIMYYRQNVLRSSEFSITLKEPVPQQNKHEMCEWYFPSTTREQSELILSKMPSDGSFLVRPSDKGPNTFVISFK